MTEQEEKQVKKVLEVLGEEAYAYTIGEQIAFITSSEKKAHRLIAMGLDNIRIN